MDDKLKQFSEKVHTATDIGSTVTFNLREHIKKSIGEATKITATEIKPIFDFYNQEVLPKFGRWMKSIFTEQFIDSMKKIKEGLIETEKDLKLFKIAMVEFGYPPSKHIDIGTARGISQAYRKNRIDLLKVMDTIMCDYYNDKLITEITREWEDNPNIKERLPILRNITMAHNLKMYNVSIPAMLAQFEGVLADSFNYKGQTNGTYIKIMLENLLDDYNELSFDQEIYQYYKKNLLARFEHGNTIGSNISRHAILHGGHKYYGEESNSIKLLLLFDHIITKIADLNNEKTQNALQEIETRKKRKA